MKCLEPGRWVLLGGALALVSGLPSFALNYFELEVYPYATAQQGEIEIEIENRTVYTARGRDDAPPPENNTGLTRNSVELSYGITDKTEVTYYRDAQRARNGDFELAANRVRVRTRFADKGELPADPDSMQSSSFRMARKTMWRPSYAASSRRIEADGLST